MPHHEEKISPAAAIVGDIVLPGDKSISHRYAMIASIAEGETRIRNYSTGADCQSTLGCVRALGIEVEGAGTEVRDSREGAGGAAARRRGIWTRGIRARRFECSRGFWRRSRSARASGAMNRFLDGPCGASCGRWRKWGRRSARARTSFRRSKSRARGCGPSITCFRWRARR